MYLMYVDESGDTGLVNSPTKYFILSALIINEQKWLPLLDSVIKFRQSLKNSHGLLMKEEIHSSVFVSKRVKTKKGISPSMRISILKNCILWLKAQNDIQIITVCIDKSKHTGGIFETAWQALIQRFENTLKYKNFPLPMSQNAECGVIISDDTDQKALTKLIRKMRRYNPVPNMGAVGSRAMPVRYVIKDPVCRASKNSYIIQMVDVIVFFAKQLYSPAKAIRKQGARNYYQHLTPIIFQKATYRFSPHKIIEL